MEARVYLSVLLFLGVLLGEGLVKGDTCGCLYNPFGFNSSRVPASISGRIIDRDSRQPLPGSYATCTRAIGTFGPTQTTDGRFTFQNASTGWYTCVGDHVNYLKNSVTVYAGSNTTIDIPLTPKNGTIIGTVYNAITYETYAGALLNCTQTTGKYITPNFVTLSDGRFFFTDILPGFWSCVGFVSGFSVASQIKEVPAGEHRVYDLLLYPLPGSISGNVVNQGSNAPVSGARINCTSDETSALGATATSYSGFSGFYDIGSFYSGRVTCSASASGYSSQSKSGVVFTGAVTIINFALPQNPSSLIGEVSDSVSSSAVSASITCSGAATATANTNAGSYSINPISTGLSACTASAAGYASRTSQIRIPASTQAYLPFILDPLTSSVIGTVFVRSGGNTVKLDGASVSCNFNRATSTNTTGDYIFDNILVSSPTAPLAFQCTASKTGFTSGSNSGSVRRGETVRVDIELILLSIQVTVLDNSTGLPISGASVQCTSTAQSHNGSTVAPGGKITFNAIAAGQYTCTAAKASYSEDSLSGVVVNATRPTANVTLYLSVPRYPIQGFIYVNLFPDISTANASVSILAADGTVVAIVKATNSSGYWTTRVPLPARYRFVAHNGANFADGFSNAYLSLTNYTTPMRTPVVAYSSSIEGVVTHSETGEVLPKATVFIVRDSGLITGNATTNENGYFIVGGLNGPETFTVRVVLSSFNASEKVVFVPSLGLTVRQDMGLTPLRYGGVAGYVYTGLQKDPVANATIVISNTATGQTVTTYTNAQGYYLQNMIEPGLSITVAASKQGLRPASHSSIFVSLGVITNVLDLLLTQKQGIVDGLVQARSSDGSLQLASKLFPIRVCVFASDYALPVTSCTGSSATANANFDDSRYGLRNVPEGLYTIYAFSTSSALVPANKTRIQVLEDFPLIVDLVMDFP